MYELFCANGQKRVSAKRRGWKKVIALGFVRPKIEDLFKWRRIVESACLLKEFFFFWITCLLKEPKFSLCFLKVRVGLS